MAKCRVTGGSPSATVCRVPEASLHSVSCRVKNSRSVPPAPGMWATSERFELPLEGGTSLAVAESCPTRSVSTSVGSAFVIGRTDSPLGSYGPFGN
jgi:hypothetical protein